MPDMEAVDVEVVDPEDPVAVECLGQYFAELRRRFEHGFDERTTLPLEATAMRLPHGMFLVARRSGEAVGCAALKLPPGAPAEIKRMWVAPTARGLGVGRRLLTELERRAAEHGYPAVRLDTNRSLVEAIAMYRTCGYREISAFNDEPFAHHWFEKALPPPLGR